MPRPGMPRTAAAGWLAVVELKPARGRQQIVDPVAMADSMETEADSHSAVEFVEQVLLPVWWDADCSMTKRKRKVVVAAAIARGVLEGMTRRMMPPAHRLEE